MLGSAIFGTDGETVTTSTYVQPISSLDAGPFKNKAAVEFPGIGTFLQGSKSLYVGLAQPEAIHLTINLAHVQARQPFVRDLEQTLRRLRTREAVSR